MSRVDWKEAFELFAVACGAGYYATCVPVEEQLNCGDSIEIRQGGELDLKAEELQHGVCV